MARLNLLPAWTIFYHELEVFFAKDPEVRVVYDNEEPRIKLYVEEKTKAEALRALLPSEKTYGSIVLKIDIIPSNVRERSINSDAFLYEIALYNNPILSYIKVVKGIFSNNLTYVVFENKVVQYFNDDLGDVHGLCSTLYQDIAKEIFKEKEGVFFCTDLPEGEYDGYDDEGLITAPFESWP